MTERTSDGPSRLQKEQSAGANADLTPVTGADPSGVNAEDAQQVPAAGPDASPAEKPEEEIVYDGAEPRTDRSVPLTEAAAIKKA